MPGYDALNDLMNAIDPNAYAARPQRLALQPNALHAPSYREMTL